MCSITDKQRKTFFYIAGQIGKDNAYAVMERVTGVDSLRKVDEHKMRGVLDELIKLSNIELHRKAKKKKFKKPLKPIEIRLFKRNPRLCTYGMKRYIDTLRKQVGFDDVKYRSFCKRIIKREEPFLMPEAQAIITALKSMRYQRWKAN
jgi:hypothetical protein